MNDLERLATPRTPHWRLKAAVAGILAAAVLIGSIAPSAAFTIPRDAAATAGWANTPVRSSSFHRHFYRNQPAAHARGVGPGWGYGGVVAGAGLAGLAAGALIDQATASGMEPIDEAVSYCADRFRSYDPSTGTYLGYDGHEHPCP